MSSGISRSCSTLEGLLESHDCPFGCFQGSLGPTDSGVFAFWALEKWLFPFLARVSIL